MLPSVVRPLPPLYVHAAAESERPPAAPPGDPVSGPGDPRPRCQCGAARGFAEVPDGAGTRRSISRDVSGSREISLGRNQRRALGLSAVLREVESKNGAAPRGRSALLRRPGPGWGPQGPARGAEKIGFRHGGKPDLERGLVRKTTGLRSRSPRPRPGRAALAAEPSRKNTGVQRGGPETRTAPGRCGRSPRGLATRWRSGGGDHSRRGRVERGPRGLGPW